MPWAQAKWKPAILHKGGLVLKSLYLRHPDSECIRYGFTVDAYNLAIERLLSPWALIE